MKRIIAIAAALAAIQSCSKSVADSEYGETYIRDNESFPVEEYMVSLGELVAYNLRVIETALIYDADKDLKDLYNKTGKSVWDDGVSFKMSDGQLSDIELSKINGENAWKLHYEGDYRLGANHDYPTEYTITATIKDKDQGKDNHYDWTVIVEGKRTEDKGYEAEFVSNSGLEYFRGESIANWDICKGNLRMTVRKDGKTVDNLMMVFKGAKWDYSFNRLAI